MDPVRWKQVDRILQQALSRPPATRKALLDQACAGDEDLRREVESLIEHERQAGSFIDSPAAGSFAADAVEPHPPDFVGRALIHYLIVEKIDEGGMGVVYRAHDTKLDRDVAVKFLPDEFTGDRERLARFTREARLLATLSHSNIAAIHGFEEADNKPFLILELVEGKTLAERLKKRRLPLQEALGICRQIADGLETAHEKGIIHRDLKPSNIMLTPEGKVKILDFGLAKALYGQPSWPEGSDATKDQSQASTSGIVLGTAPYMSPEQATGKPVDKRTDVWAFGCILYECLTGKAAFHGDTVSETLAAVIGGEPDWKALPKETPERVREVLRTCLEKDPGVRLHDVADAFIEIDRLPANTFEAAPAAGRISLPWLVAGLGAALIVGVLAGTYLMRHLRPASPLPFVRTVVKIEKGHRLAGMSLAPWYRLPTRTAMAISSEGGFIVYSASEEYPTDEINPREMAAVPSVRTSASSENPTYEINPRLYIRRTDQMESRPISGTEGGISPFLSPDNRWVGFWADGKLKKVSVDGGTPTVLCNATVPFGASWGRDNNIVFSANQRGGLSRVPAQGGVPESLTTPDRTKEEFSHRLPHYLPDGKGVLFTVMRELYDLQPRVALLDLKRRNWRVLLEDAAEARYIPTGHLVFLRQGTLMAAQFFLHRLEVTGQPVPATAKVMQSLNYATPDHNSVAGQFCISDSGSLIYASGGIVPDWRNSVVWVNQKGIAQPIESLAGSIDAPRLSPDGQRIASPTMGTEFRVWTYDLNRGTASPVTSEGKAFWSVWTPDGKRVVFNWWRSGLPNLFWQAADGSGAMERLTTSEYHQVPGSFSPDGTVLVFVEDRPETGWDILLLDLHSRHVTPFLESRANEVQTDLSPDGRWLAYVSDESGVYQVYVRPFPGPGGKWQVSSEGGDQPLWARSGKQLFYRWGDQVWVVDVRLDAGFAPSKPRLLFEKPYLHAGPVRGWDISADGQRFLMVKYEEIKLPPVTEMILVQNWFEELKRLAPMK